MTGMAKYKRSRNGCKSCKKLKIKCDEGKPRCQNCQRRNIESCDYTKILRWGGRTCKRKKENHLHEIIRKGAQGADTSAIYLRPAGHTSWLLNSTSSCLDTANNNSDNGLSLISSDAAFRIPWTGPIAFSQLPLTALQLPLPLPDVLLNTPHYLDLFEFYMRETAYLLVPLPRELYANNPFSWKFGQMALSCPTLLYPLLAFSANHRNMMAAQKKPLSLLPPLEGELSYHRPSSESIPALIHNEVSSNNTLTDELLAVTFNKLLADLKNEKKRTSDCTLATIMMLAAFDIFFSDRRRKWRAHVNGARRLIMERHCSADCIILTLPDTAADEGDLFFLTRWFSYLDIIGSLSSTSRVITTEKLQAIKYKSNLTPPTVLRSRRVTLSDLEAGTGMEYTVLSYLADVSRFIKEKESKQDESCIEGMSQGMLSQVLELDYEINTYLTNSERDRDQIYEKYYSQESWENYRSYHILRVTNLIFGLTGSYQLKRRVLNLSLDSKIVQDLLINITKLVDENIPIDAASTSCLSFCLFSCGCELLNDTMAQYRPIYMQRIDALNEEGVNCAAMAKQIMTKCWKSKKNWWDILREENLDITFAI